MEEIQSSVMKIWGKVAFFDNFVGGISHTLMPGFFYGATFVIAAFLAAMQAISIGYMTAAVSYAVRIHDIFTNLISTYNGYKKARGEVTAIQGYLELEDERDSRGRASAAEEVVSSFRYMTAPQTSPAARIGEAARASRSEPSTGCNLPSSEAVRVKLCRASINSSREGETRRSSNSFLGSPETATTWSRSQITTG